MRAMKAATGWTIRIADSVWRAPEGRSKSEVVASENKPESARLDQCLFLQSQKTKRTGGVANAHATAGVALAVAEDAVGDSIEGGERDGLDDGGRQGAQQQQGEGGEEEDGQRRGRTEKHGCCEGSGPLCRVAQREAEGFRSGQFGEQHSSRFAAAAVVAGSAGRSKRRKACVE